MPRPRPATLLALALTLALPLPTGALAQDTNVGPDGNPLPGLPQEPLEPATGGGAAVAPSATTPAPTGTTPDVEATTPLTTAPAPAPGAGADTPVPPPYLIPGASAQQQPISRVAALSEPAVPAEPLRLAALAAALLAVLLVALTTLLRALGVRTPVTQPAVAPADSRLSRLGERLRGTADDMRDFLRRSR